jgi:hypothetical protein
MGWGYFHLFALLVTTFVTAAVIGRAPRRPTLIQAIAAPVVGLIVGALAFTSSLHMCEEGTPFAQWALPALCLAAMFAFAERSLVRRVASLGLIFAAFGLSHHYTRLVHEPGLIGVATPPEFTNVTITPFWHSPLTGLYARHNPPKPPLPPMP